jgi:hypothetical protein
MRGQMDAQDMILDEIESKGWLIASNSATLVLEPGSRTIKHAIITSVQ